MENSTSPGAPGKGPRSFLSNNSLSLVLLAAFLLCWVGQAISGFLHHNEEQREHGQPPLTFGRYLRSGDFLEATFENWESEFFQMGAFVILAAFLHQRGSGESKDPDAHKAEEDKDLEPTPDAPRVVHRGGLALKLYSHSLSLALLALFVVCFGLHAVTGAAARNEEAQLHGEAAVTVLQYMASSQFWFESFQNWQSEFLSVAALVLLSVWLREKGSPESKPVNAPHSRTGK
ncbi:MULTISPECIES: DUF6766 family protein [Myxococcus]|uniref:Transmembrane protein n=1 Tax=Myxococcus llanfairpwllgwyngyllgogerychwyrndrobwllllantysiliogogogochensis TaxID=2590453 RepID=A0A540X7L4_9BACT|nr:MULTISPECIES: DUF6766 family protein [Myxococcus]NTX00937.1 hypothetical protein [Myxococcus sp. CA040A]TQF17285.1 hypothetical protein FJV41_03835 [Myxococcus llanfairpwllgwyngyllgogerychwyrndrobwllllantysiliogogogochensis]